MKNLTIGKRIVLGFTALIIIMIALGSLAVINMRHAAAEAKRLAILKVPQVRIANDEERSSHLTLFEMRGYGDTAETNYLQAGLQHLEETKKHIAEARELGSRSPLLANLKIAADAAENKIQVYEQYVQQTVARNQGIQQSRTDLTTATKAFMDNCNAYLAGMNDQLATDVQTKTPPETLLDCVQKISLMNEVKDYGNTVHLATLRSQAERDLNQISMAQINFAMIKSDLDELQQDTNSAIHLIQIKNCQAAADAYQNGMNELLTNWQAREEASSNVVVTGTALLTAAQDSAENGLNDTTAAAGSAAMLLSTATTTIVLGLALAMIIGVSLAFYISRGTNQVLNRVVQSLADGSSQVVASAGQVSATSQSLAEGASEQAASLEETSSSLEEMAAMTKRNAENARQANDLAKLAREAADKGAGGMATMATAMAAIKDSSDDIAKIIKTIDEIAFQTNILALNAAVEAARAGEAGMGFAVVADEVRNLAQRCAHAARETTDKIEGAILKTTQGVEISSSVAQGLNEIASKVRQVNEIVNEVANTSNEQTLGVNQINTAVSQIDNVTQSTAASAEESAAAAEQLNAQAQIMKQSVAELLQLVGGTSGQEAISPTIQPVHSRKVSPALLTAKQNHRDPKPTVLNTSRRS